MKTSLVITRRVLRSELFPFIAFLCLTILMTWPWVLHLRDAAADSGDSYLGAWIIWWDYHATFTDPLRLFQANLFFPYSYTLAFSEHSYGIALACFPFFALGLRPLTVNGIATIIGFAFSGYGAFRLTRTLTGSNGAAWVAGVAFAFVPYRFHHLPHLVYLSSGWIPLLLEALILFARQRSRWRAAWLGVAFFMNGLTSIHWFVLTLVPLALTALFLVLRHRAERDRAFWLRGSLTMGAASFALLPFMIPYIRVMQLYGFKRGPEEAAIFSARLQNWLLVDWQNKLWQGFGRALTPYQTELALWPGLMVLLLALAGIFLIKTPRERGANLIPSRAVRLCFLLDTIVVGAAILALITTGFGGFKIVAFGHELFSASRPFLALSVSAVAFVVRCCLAYPKVFRSFDRKNLTATLRDSQRSEAFGVGAIWAVTGFFGSFGMNFFFHRTLYEYVPLFRSIRVPARWAMICYLGLAVLAAVGARRLAGSFPLRRPAWIFALYCFIILLVLFDQRAAPLALIHGAVDPDPLTVRLGQTTMRGGIVELPAGEGNSNYLYTLRAADHARPLVDGVSGFQPKIPAAIEAMTKTRPVSDQFLDLLEAIPTSYVVVHNSFLSDESRRELQDFLKRGIDSGRLRLITRYGEGPTSDELFVVTRTEPDPTAGAK